MSDMRSVTQSLTRSLVTRMIGSMDVDLRPKPAHAPKTNGDQGPIDSILGKAEDMKSDTGSENQKCVASLSFI